MTSAFFLCLAWAAAGITRQQNANTWLFFGICLKLNLKKKRGRQFFQPEIGFTSLPEQQEGLTVLKSSLYPCPLHNTGICVCKMDLSSAERGEKNKRTGNSLTKFSIWDICSAADNLKAPQSS